MKARAIQCAVWFCLPALGIFSHSSLAQEHMQAARDVAQAFLQSEFNGELLDERKKLVTFSPQRLADFERAEPGPGPGPYVLYMSSRPVFVVSAAEVVNVKVEGIRATAVVSYRRLARVDHFGAEELAVFPDKKANDLVTLNLVFGKEKWWSLKGQWWILDPPPPRVSKQVMVEYYESVLKWYVERQKEIGKLPKHQQDAYDRKSGTLRILKNLP